jgi:hypothetical protein
MKRAVASVLLLVIGLALFMLFRNHSPDQSAPVVETLPDRETNASAAPQKPAIALASLRPRSMTTAAPASNSNPSPASAASLAQSPAPAVHTAAEPTNTPTNAVPPLRPPPDTSPESLVRLCTSNRNEIVWAANVWCGVHAELLLPPNLMLLTNELRTPAALVCPAHPLWPQRATTNWAEFRPEWITYELSSTARNQSRYAHVNLSFNYLYCPVHKRWSLGDRPAPAGGWGPWWDSMNPGKSRFGPKVR